MTQAVLEIEPSPDGETLSNSLFDVVNNLQQRNRPSIKGRPTIAIPEDQLVMLLQNHYNITDIASLLQVSPRTIRRRIIQYGLEDVASYSSINDSEVDEIAKQFVHEHPNSGQKSFEGYLRSYGLKLQRSRIRASIMRVDPYGVQNRFRQVLKRRQYSVPMPNSLWHLDGNHKLIRWRIVVHGGIDGYSRLPIFIKASNNNWADTVLQCFLNAVEKNGLPSRVRTDKGGENASVSRYMLLHPHRGPGRGSCITGRSVHNQRIERFWRNLFEGCLSLYYTLFYELEDCNLLNPDDPVDLFCVHHIFLPRLNEQLLTFQQLYSHHKLRGCGNKSPYQLWISELTQEIGDDEAMQGIYDDTVNKTSHHL